MLELKFLGNGAAFYPILGNTNAFFTAGDDLFFLDFGESAFEKVFRMFDLTRYHRVWVLLTHLHADHCGSLASMLSYMHCVLHKEVTIVHPVDTVVRLLDMEGIGHEFYSYLPALPEDCPVEAQPVSVPHAADMRAFGYILRYDGDSVYYSGDAAQLPEEVLRAFLSGALRRIYQDTASHESPCHCYYKRLEAVIPLERRRDVYCMHLDSDMTQTLTEAGFSVVEAVKENKRYA